MIDWLTEKWHGLTWESIAISIILFVVTFSFSLGAIAFVAIAITATAIELTRKEDAPASSPVR